MKQQLAYIYLNDLYNSRGSTYQVFNVVDSLSKYYEITFISGWISNKHLNEILNFFSKKLVFKVKKIPIKLITGNILFEKISRAFYSFFILFHLKFNYYDAIYTRDFSFLFFYSYVQKFFRLKAPIFYEPHTIYHKSSPNKVSFEQEKKALSCVNYYFPISHGIKEDLIRYFELSEDKITVLPDGVDFKLFKSIHSSKKYAHKKYAIPLDKKIIVYSGSFFDWKGVDTIVLSAKFIKSKDVVILIFGGRGESFDEINRLVKEEKLEDSIVIDSSLPYEELIKILKSSDIAVIPNKNTTSIGSKYTSPLKIFEYMAAGLPIVSSDVPAMKEILDNEKNTLYFKAGDEKSLAKSIDRLMFDDKLRSAIKTNNLIKVNDYSWNNRAMKTHEVVRTIINT